MTDKEKLSAEALEGVNGGSMWIPEDDAKNCGIELRNEDGTPGEWGYLWNSGDYYFKGRKLTQNETARLLDFYARTGRPAESVEECMEYWGKVYRGEI